MSLLKFTSFILAQTCLVMVINGCNVWWRYRTPTSNAQKNDAAIVDGNTLTSKPSAICDNTWCWENPLPQGNYLAAIWGPSDTDLFAVGNNGTIIHYDGQKWNYQDSKTGNNLFAIWGANASDVYAVGNFGTIVHYNGQKWESIIPPSTNNFTSIFGFSANNIYVAGSAGIIVHYNGTSWSSLSLPAESATLDFIGLVNAGSNKISAVATNGTIVSGDYTGFSSTPPNLAISGLIKVWKTDQSNLWAVGPRDIYQYNASGWTISYSLTSSSGELFQSIYGRSATDIYASSWIPTNEADETIYHFDGTSWSSQSPNFINCSLKGLWANQTYLYAVGDFGAIYQYNGKDWQAKGYNSISNNANYHIWGTAADNIYVASGKGTILHYDGKQWGAQSIGTTADLRYIWGSSAQDIFAVGDSGVIAHYDGTSWKLMNSGSSTSEALAQISGSGPKDVFAVGSGGTIIHYDGNSWSTQNSGTTKPLYAIWVFAPNKAWAVGFAGTFLEYNGATWTASTALVTTDSLSGIWATSDKNAYVVTSSAAKCYHFNGTSFETINLPLKNSFIWGIDATRIFAGGLGSTILFYDGSSWTKQTLITDQSPQALWGTSTDNLYAVSYGGIIIHRVKAP